MKKALLYIVLVVAIIACSEPVKKIEKKTEVATATEAKYHFEDSLGLYRINLKYPVIDGNFNPDVVIKINNSIMENFHVSVDKDGFIEAHQGLPSDLIPENKDWSGVLNNTYEIHQSDSLLFITISVYQYFLGAAHGFSHSSTYMYDLTNGKELNPNEFIEISSLSSDLLVSKINASLPDSVCWGLKNDSSMYDHLSNFHFIKDSVIFTIDDYELCPYAFGIPEMRFSMEELAPVLTVKSFKQHFEINPVVDEGEIATH